MYFGESVLKGSALCYELGLKEELICVDEDLTDSYCNEWTQELLTEALVAEDFLPYFDDESIYVSKFNSNSNYNII